MNSINFSHEDRNYHVITIRNLKPWLLLEWVWKCILLLPERYNIKIDWWSHWSNRKQTCVQQIDAEISNAISSELTLSNSLSVILLLCRPRRTFLQASTALCTWKVTRVRICKQTEIDSNKYQRHLYYKNGILTLPGVDVTDITYHPSLSLSNRFNSNDTSYVKPNESLTVVKSL